MKTPKPSKKSSMDWYFPQFHGHVMLPSARNKQAAARVDSVPHMENDNVEARHRASWRRQPRRLFGIFVISLFVFQSDLFAAEAALSSVTKAKAAQKAKAKADIAAKAKKTYPKEAKKAEKMVSGTVVSVRKSNISVELGQSEENGAEEMLIPINDEVKLSNAGSTKDLGYGDLVEVKYIQIYLPSKIKGENPSVIDTRALEIRLVQKAADRAAPVAAASGVPA